jgi:hypothetical protein
MILRLQGRETTTDYIAMKIRKVNACLRPSQREPVRVRYASIGLRGLVDEDVPAIINVLSFLVIPATSTREPIGIGMFSRSLLPFSPGPERETLRTLKRQNCAIRT